MEKPNLIKNYIEKNKIIQESFEDYIDNNGFSYFQALMESLEDKKILENKHEFQDFLYFISSISNHHHRSPHFNAKIDKFLLEIIDQIKQTFSNSELFHIFQSNKRLLFFLIEQSLLTIDSNIAEIIEERYDLAFFPEITKKFKSKKKKETKNIENFEEKRKIGENDTYICQLIRNDDIDEFISYVNKLNISLSSKVTNSLFETNPFLLKNKPTLIEYSAFFGSIQIFKYLYMNKIELTRSLFVYAVHGRNYEIIHLLEEKKIENKTKDTIKECVIESIKCHHSDLVEYFVNNYCQQNNDQTVFLESIQYHNFLYFPSKIENKFAFFYLCKYNYIEIIKLLITSSDIDINYTIKIQ